MKIMFYCGSLEFGRDGVGDYTRQLAIQLIKNGHKVIVISLFDRGVSVNIKEVQTIENVKLEVGRIPYSFPNSKRFVIVNTFVKRFKPEWISLQYVPYSFHAKGLPYTLAKHFKAIETVANWHIMFHELWIGFTKSSSLKHKLVGFFQLRILKSFFNFLNPKLVTTTNRLFQCLLLKHGIQSSILPLFSNIPVAPINKDFRSKLVQELSSISGNQHNWRLAGIFGNLHLRTNLELAIVEQVHIADLKGTRLAVLGFGYMHSSGEREFLRLKEKFRHKADFLHFGQQSAIDVSNYLQVLDLGISCTPKQHVAKSGVYAAMRLHDLQVVFPDEIKIPEYVTEIDDYFNEISQRAPASWSVDYISIQFLKMLDQFNS